MTSAELLSQTTNHLIVSWFWCSSGLAMDETNNSSPPALSSVEDIMKARLKTVGVEEYHFVMDNCPSSFNCSQTFAH